MDSNHLSTIESYLKSISKNTRDDRDYEKAKLWFDLEFGYADQELYNKFIQLASSRIGV